MWIKKSEGKVVPIHAMKANGGRRGMVPLILNLGARWRQWRTQEFCSVGGGVQQIQLRTEDRENGDLGAVAP